MVDRMSIEFGKGQTTPKKGQSGRKSQGQHLGRPCYFQNTTVSTTTTATTTTTLWQQFHSTSPAAPSCKYRTIDTPRPFRLCRLITRSTCIFWAPGSAQARRPRLGSAQLQSLNKSNKIFRPLMDDKAQASNPGIGVTLWQAQLGAWMWFKLQAN